MTLKRRNFIGLTGMAAATGLVTGFTSCNSPEGKEKAAVVPGSAFQPMTGDVEPISLAERQARLATTPCERGLSDVRNDGPGQLPNRP